MVSKTLKTQITIGKGIGLLFISLAFSIGILFVYTLFMFGAQAAPEDAVEIFIIAKTFDIALTQSISFGVLCTLFGIISMFFRRAYPLQNVLLVSVVVVGAFYFYWISQIDSRGILLKL